MIKKEVKKWFLYSYLPKEVNKLFIYTPTSSCAVCEKNLSTLKDYLRGRVDTIGKVTRVDPEEYTHYLKGEEHYPVVVFNGSQVEHSGVDLVSKLEQLLPDVGLNDIDEMKVKALKDGKNLL